MIDLNWPSSFCLVLLLLYSGHVASGGRHEAGTGACYSCERILCPFLLSQLHLSHIQCPVGNTTMNIKFTIASVKSATANSCLILRNKSQLQLTIGMHAQRGLR